MTTRNYKKEYQQFHAKPSKSATAPNATRPDPKWNQPEKSAKETARTFITSEA